MFGSRRRDRHLEWGADQVLEGRSLDLSSKARAFALMYLAAADASIACWDAKFTYNYWRPFPAFFAGDADGNPATVGDSTWAPLLPTSPHRSIRPAAR